MFVTSKFASAWLDQELSAPQLDSGNAGRPRQPAAVVRHAWRPLQTRAGRCIAIKLVPPADVRGTPRFFVLFESSYERSPRPRWVPLERVLDEAEVARWVATGFRS
jgi:hypothetical protein